MSEDGAKTATVDHGIERLRGELRDAVDLIRRSGGAVVFEEYPGALQDQPSLDGPANGVDAGRIRGASDAAATAHGSLIDAANALAETLAHLEATGWRTNPLRSWSATP
jgi:hypothetical protein